MNRKIKFLLAATALVGAFAASTLAYGEDAPEAPVYEERAEAPAPSDAPPASDVPRGALGEPGGSGGLKTRGGAGFGGYKQLVSDGVISQATADKVETYLKDQKGETSGGSKTARKAGLYADMVSAGVLTQAEADAIKAAQEAKLAKFQANIDANRPDPFAKLVSGGVITQAEADSIKAYFEKEVEKVKAMTSDELKAYLEAQKGGDRWSRLVSDGVITQAKADAIKAAAPVKERHTDFGGHALRQLLDGGTITQAEFDAITAWSDKKMETLKAETPDKAAREESKAERKDPFAEMVEAGVITQATADKIKAAAPEKSSGRVKAGKPQAGGSAV
ncbi:MAG: hypothetical protein LBU36_02285 [Clostridiales bacterium]|jgi:uncharacterized protein YutE (UPF0331/DUF86 family)|nr:hypothetical protein [Clostridiales bacterium]